MEKEEYYDDMELILMKEAVEHDIEYKASAVWQAVFSRKFPRPWQLLCEQAPTDDSRRRVDMRIIRYDSGTYTISPVLWVEVKRKGGGLPKGNDGLEAQGLDAAVQKISAYNLASMYVITAWGLRFRAWIVGRNASVLEPSFGSPHRDNRDDYLDMRSQTAFLNLNKRLG